ncbi:PLP-dependent aminotransferase family protein [Desulfosporosinus sp. BG]|uniref:MocR-like pyridoxine biosynthesis transcription factor PdxR n=1 Tax=Desulfosporosinus sp. BG TaxID=1633135 RepID=UPI00083A2BD1|nr:PLP-dependent aminotransferase family protein [Desulfosporosinus sp. BG]ODA40879.1 Transcriptional regulator, GntR family domain [Desulfosporosinus sp. BG]
MWGIELNRKSEQPLKRQIYQELKTRIMNGQLKSNDALPSTRELSKALNVSRNTVGEAYEMLIAEGFVINRQGAATRVAAGLYMDKSDPFVPRENRLIKQTLKADFRTGRPDLRQFPHFLWQQLLHKASVEMPIEMYGYTGPQGLPALRSEITAWLFRSRGLTVNSDDIFITAGATHALHLLCDLLCGNGKKVLMEDPCHSGMLQTFLYKGCPIVPVPVDSQGMQMQYLPDGRDACAIYVTPSHQFPLGGILPAARRAALIRFARENGLYILEDDYDSEFRYCGEPIAPLYAMDPQHVIYVGTFSKSLFPALRIGYVILPEQLHRQWGEIRTHTDVQNPPFEQAALAEFLRTRKLDRHVQKMRRIYGQRRQVLMESLKDAFGSAWMAYGDDAGLHIAIDFPGGCFDETFRKRCLQNGIYITPAEIHCIEKGRLQSKLIIGYGHLEPEEIRNGVEFLRDYMESIAGTVR